MTPPGGRDRAIAREGGMMGGGPVRPIAVVQGAPGATVQDVFRSLVGRWQPTIRMAGVIAESHGLADRACTAGYLLSIRTGVRYPIFRDLGPGSTTCHLEGGGALTAAEAVLRDIAAGCDLVLLSKFGRLEAAGQGLFDAFTAAVANRVPLLTSVSAAFAQAWERFAAPSFVVLPADPVAIDAWRQAVR